MNRYLCKKRSHPMIWKDLCFKLAGNLSFLEKEAEENSNSISIPNIDTKRTILETEIYRDA